MAKTSLCALQTFGADLLLACLSGFLSPPISLSHPCRDQDHVITKYLNQLLNPLLHQSYSQSDALAAVGKRADVAAVRDEKGVFAPLLYFCIAVVGLI
mgnify:CR=1 FL=1